MQMMVGDVMACEHCPKEIVDDAAESGATIRIERPVTHPIVEIVAGRPTLHCPSLYTDQEHISARMRLVGTAERL